MKLSQLIFMSLTGLLLVGCVAEMETVTAVPTRIPATDTPVVETGTAVTTTTSASTSTHTATFTPPPTLTPSPTLVSAPSPTKTSNPITTDITAQPSVEGQLIFIWDPRSKPLPEEMGPDEFPTSNMYRAIPGDTPDHWTIQPILTNLRIGKIFIAPNRQKIALLLLEDTNADGTFRIESDVYKLYMYHFDAELLEQVVDNMGFRGNLSWLPDNRAVIVPQDTNISLITFDGSLPQTLTDQGPYPPNALVFNPVVSPDGTQLAITLLSGVALSTNVTALFDLENRTFKPLADLVDSATLYISMSWSPNSEWLAFTNGYNRGLFVANTQTSDVLLLRNAETRCFPTWSPIASQLTFSCGGDLYSWDANSQITQELASAEAAGPPAWSPAGDHIAASFVEDGRTGLWIIESANNNKQILDLSTTARPTIWSPIIWSPDGEWLLFLSEQDSQSGYYIINRSGGEPHLVLDTTGLIQPRDFAWLPDDLNP